MLEETGKVVEFENEFRLKDGSVRTCLMSSNCLVLDGEICVLNISRDITERKKMEQQLQKLNESL